MIYDVFNGDADGIFSLIQLQKNELKESKKITSFKRDTALLKHISPNSGDLIRSLDIGIDKNFKEVKLFLDQGVKIFFADHHKYEKVPEHKNFENQIFTKSIMCTSKIIANYINKEESIWAVPGIFGDNLYELGLEECKKNNLNSEESLLLKELGELVNYNSYGENIADLNYHPIDVFDELMLYDSPLDLVKEKNSIFFKLKECYSNDLEEVIESVEELHNDNYCKVFLLPNKISSRRISGIFGNQKAIEFDNQSILILTYNEDGSYRVSIRAPINQRYGASNIAKKFSGGGGREAAAGINALNPNQLTTLIKSVYEEYEKK